MVGAPRSHPLAGSARAVMDGARRTGAADPAETIVVTLFLRRGSAPEDRPSLSALGAPRPRGRSYLSREEFARRHGARDDDLAVVRAFAANRGLAVLEESRARRSVRLSGPAGEVARAFGVRLARYEYPGGSYRGREGPVRLPPELVGVVEGVFGLDNRPQAWPHFRRRTRADPAGASYTPLAVAEAYSFPTGLDGTGQSIALIELGGGFQPEDLTAYFQSLGVGLPAVSAVGVDGAANAPTGDPNGPDGEVELDLEVAGAIAPGAQFTVYFAPNTDQGFLDAVTTAIHDASARPTIVSISWGGPEPTWTAQARAAFESEFEDAAALGVTVLVAAGDYGASDGTTGGTPTVDFPSSAPGVIGCGGTRLTLSGTSIASEVVWNELASGEGATGGGVSEAFPLPTYQTGANVPVAPNGFAGRGVPDVAGDADPSTGYQVLVDGSATVVGGTSAVAPLWAALIARINQSLGTPIGFVNALLYSDEPDFRDIVSGNNGGYAAGPGWDPCTGLGSPNGAALLAALGKP